MDHIDWKNIKLVIFDVDGTMYNQKDLRYKMVFSLASYYLPRPGKWSDLKIIKTFREEREKHKGKDISDLEHDQYLWCREKTGKDINHIKTVVDKWIYTYPVKYLKNYVFPGLKDLFTVLDKAGIYIAVLSDYPAEEKLSAMGLRANLVMDAANKKINALKPNPAGLKYITEHFNVNVSDSVFIGDREDTDGVAARKINMQYIIVDRHTIYKKDYFRNLARQIETR